MRKADYEFQTGLVGIQTKRIREMRGISVKDLAARSGVARTAIREIEAGEGAPTETTIIRLANALDVPPASLLGGGDKWRADNNAFEAGYETGVADAVAAVRRLLSKITPGGGHGESRDRGPEF